MAKVDCVVVVDVLSNFIVGMDSIGRFRCLKRVGVRAICIFKVPFGCARTKECGLLAWVAMVGCLGNFCHGGELKYIVCTSS